MLEQKLLEYLDAFDVMASNLGPQALDTALRVVVIDAAGNLLSGVVFAVLAFAAFKVGQRARRRAEDEFNNVFASSDWSTVGVLFYAGGSISAFIALGFLTFIWNWVALFAPHLELARQVLEKL